MDEKVKRTMENLTLNRMKPYFAESREQLFEIIRELLKESTLITSGGSVTLKESGVIDLLRNEYSNAFRDRSAETEKSLVEAIMRMAFSSDTYFTSTNALTENGELYNVDGNGNRVAAMIYGPSQVIVVAGVNKIVRDLDEARARVEKTAAPRNTARLEKNTPCAKSGECAHCHSDDRICCSYVTLAHQRVPDRIKVIIVNESLGY